MKGYFSRPDATAEAIDRDGWFRTGDIGTRDADGYLYIVDRKKDMIIRGGFNVYPRELEEVLLTHPEVAWPRSSACRTPATAKRSRRSWSAPPGATVTEADLIAWCKENMAAYKYPRLVEFRDACR